MSLYDMTSNDAYMNHLSSQLATRYNAPTFGGPAPSGPNVRTQNVQAIQPGEVPKPRTLSENIQNAENKYDTGKKVYDYGSKAYKWATGPSPTPTAAPPAGATQPVGEGMGVFPTSSFPGAGGAEAAPGASSGAGAVALPAAAVAAGAYGMKRYNDLGYGNGYRDFIDGSWQNHGLDENGLTKGLSKGAKDAGHVVMDAGKLFTQGQGTNPMNPMSWMMWGKDIAHGLGDLIHGIHL